MAFFAGLFYYNANSKHQLDKLEQGLAEVRSRARTQAISACCSASADAFAWEVCARPLTETCQPTGCAGVCRRAGGV